MLNKINTSFLILGSVMNLNVLFAQDHAPQIEAWVTTPDRANLFTKQAETIPFSTNKGRGGQAIVIDESTSYQAMDGFGYALTGGSARLLTQMSAGERAKILKDIFGRDGNNIGTSYLRLSIGASDLNDFVFSYDDLEEGKTDFELKKFDLAQDKKDVIPVLKEILAINPEIKILGSPWSAPTWMKESNNVRGGRLKDECYEVYAQYFVKYVQAMKKQGITIDAITVQNEPMNSRNTPSMPWFAAEQLKFVKENLGPAFEKAGIQTKILILDHNCDRPDFPLMILNDPIASKYVDGTAFHHYVGEMGTMSYLHIARPDKNVYFTEQMTVEKPNSPEINIANPVKTLILGASKNWSKNVILWNLAADPLNDPHTDNGGCGSCQGAITIDGDKVTKNVAYYVIAHASKFVTSGSVRIGSTNAGDKVVNIYEDEQSPMVYRTTLNEADVLPNVAFRTPEGKIVLIVANDTFSDRMFRIQYKGQFANVRLNPGAVGTYVW